MRRRQVLCLATMEPADPTAAEDPARSVAAVLAAASAVPPAEALARELACGEAAVARGYFLPDEEEAVRLRYSQYLAVRAALLETLAELAPAAGRAGADWRERLPLFVTAFAAGCVLMRATRFIVELAAERPVVWKKLDEADVRSGIPRKSFTGLYRAATAPATLARFIAAADFYFENRPVIRKLADDPALAPVLALLEEEEPFIQRRRSAALRTHASYRWFSFLRRNRSAWRQVMFGIFEASGRAVAELRQPGVKPSGAPKRITSEIRRELARRIRPGDVFVTRHDDALSNLFLPGFWPHAALCFGEGDGFVEIPDAEGWFLEAKKDGVRFRPAAETLGVDALVVIRPPLDEDDLQTALRRAAGHAGKPYDFLFDFRSSDRLACTEVIYRGMHGIGPVRFQLREVGGRLCLPAEDLLDQALDCGFRIVAAAGLGAGGILSGTRAEIAFHGSRQPV